MMRRFHLPAAALVCLVGALTVVGCSSAQTVGAVSGSAPKREPIALPASFEGDLPCADCEGIRYHLDLFEDRSFFLRMSYLGRGAVLDDMGRWSVGSDGTTLALHGGREAPVMFRIVDGATLRKLDLEGRDISSSLNYELRRGAEFSPIEPRLEMRGMYRYMADAALFEECLTGRRFPVAMEADNVALERAYREARVQAGEPILVTLEGRIAQRPAMEGETTVLSLVPERFIGIWPAESCASSATAVALQGTEWKLILLGDAPVAVADPSRRPSLTLNEDGRVSGFDGCNRMAGSYEVTGRSIGFSQMASTKMACIDGMELELAFAGALDRARRFNVVGTHLDLFGGDGKLLARFEAVTPP
jgi:copper homeostasis protein (lipoprotein)